MNRSNLILAGLFATGGAAVLVYTYLMHGTPGGSPDVPAPAPAADAATVVAPLSQSPAVVQEPTGAQDEEQPAEVSDLENLLKNGDPQTERPRALQSLRAIALRDGDENGRIREVIRQAIYHADDEQLTQDAQRVLDEIEQSSPRN